MTSTTSSRTLIITGGSTGIGRATAQRFLSEGWKVISLSRRPCPEDGVRSVAVDFSVGGWREPLQAQLNDIIDEGVIALVHNAALLEKDSAWNLDADRLRHVLEVNVVAPTVLNGLLRPKMHKGSSVLYIGSTLSEKAVANTASYVTSKHALVGLMRATCQDGVGSGIHTACICPGFVDTEMLRAHVSQSGDVEAVFGILAKMSAHNRLIQPAEIADLVYSCATQPVIDGAVIHANLGQIEH